MKETTFGPVLGLAAVAVFVVALDCAWRLLSEHVPGWMQSRDARTAARQTRTLEALGRIHERGAPLIRDVGRVRGERWDR